MTSKPKNHKGSKGVAPAQGHVIDGGLSAPRPHEEECALEITNNIFRTVERLFREDQSMIMVEYPGRSSYAKERRYGYDYITTVVLYSRGDS